MCCSKRRQSSENILLILGAFSGIKLNSLIDEYNSKMYSFFSIASEGSYGLKSQTLLLISWKDDNYSTVKLEIVERR